MAVSKKKEKKEEDKKVSDGTRRRKRDKKSRKISRWSGLILFLILFLLGFLLWIGGEIKDGGRTSSQDESVSNAPLSVTTPGDGSVIIIE